MTVNSTTQTNYAALGTQSQSSVSGSSFSDMMQQLANQLLNTVDTNKNGSIDKTEFSAAAQQLSQNPATANTDTSAANLEKVFNSIDTNQDGNIDGNELLSALQNSAQQSSQTSGVHHHHHHAHSQSGASGMASQNTTTSAATQSSTTAQSSTESASNLQSILMKNILSAYGVSQSQSSGSSLSLAV